MKLLMKTRKTTIELKDLANGNDLLVLHYIPVISFVSVIGIYPPIGRVTTYIPKK